jgi:hypothetical protein
MRSEDTSTFSRSGAHGFLADVVQDTLPQDLAPTLARAHMSTEDPMTFFAIDTSHFPNKIRHFFVDHLIAMVWAAQLEMGDPPAPPRVELARTKRTDHRGYEVLFGKAPKFSSPIDWPPAWRGS